jgi:hypothetical protein
LDISEFTYGEVAEWGNVQQLEVYENVDKIFVNMQQTGDWLQERFVEILELLQPIHLNGVKYAGCDGIDQDGNTVADNCEEDQFPPSLVHRDGLAISSKHQGITRKFSKEGPKSGVCSCKFNARHLKT